MTDKGERREKAREEIRENNPLMARDGQSLYRQDLLAERGIDFLMEKLSFSSDVETKGRMGENPEKELRTG